MVEYSHSDGFTFSYEILKKIGQGSNGEVFQIKYSNGEILALKRSFLHFLGSEYYGKLYKDLIAFNYPSLIQIKGYYISQPEYGFVKIETQMALLNFS